MSDYFYHTVVADPPWPEQGAGKCKRGADRHYNLLKVADIAPTITVCPFFQAIAFDCHFYLWATNNYVKAAMGVLDELGFRYVTKITWAKDRVSIGQYFRGQTEELLFAVRGDGFSLRTERRDLTTLLVAPVPTYPKGHPKQGRRIHSRKPEAAYQLVEARSRGPYLELFATRDRPGWTCWGNDKVND